MEARFLAASFPLRREGAAPAAAALLALSGLPFAFSRWGRAIRVQHLGIEEP